jgi:hypothetical protein
MFSAQAQDYIEVPLYMNGVVEDPRQHGPIYKYKNDGKVLKKEVTASSKKPTDVVSFVSYLMYLYQNNKKAEFKKIFTPKGYETMNAIPKETFEEHWKILSKIKKGIVNFHYPDFGGTIVSWTAGKHPRALFLKKINGEYKIDHFVAQKDDVEFQNKSYYYTILPNKEEKANVVKSFNLSDANYQLDFKVTKERPYIHIFKKEEGKWKPKVIVKDNGKGKFKFDDVNNKVGEVSIKFEKEHFTQGVKHELLVLQSNYQFSYYPIEMAKEGNLIIE